MTDPARFVIIQTSIQDFRIKVFDELHRRCAGSLEVWSGMEISDTNPSPTLAANFKWHRRLENFYLLGGLLRWQSGHFASALSARVCVLEFNPRILSTWLILLCRKILPGRTVVWGHLLPRAGVAARTQVIRFVMLHLADQVNLYTMAEGKLLQGLYPRLRLNVSPNAVMWRRECRVGGGPNRHRMLFVARMVAEKKPILLLNAFALALARLPERVMLDFVGDGPLYPALAARVEELGLARRVNLHGAVYRTEEIRALSDEAIVSFSPGYVGLSATQSFGFGVPMLIAENEQHSVEITLCRRGVNCDFFPSDDPAALAERIVEFATCPPAWAQDRERICAELRDTYTLDHMCDGFMHHFEPFLKDFPRPSDPIHVGIAWIGLPYYAARVISEARKYHPEWRITVISSRVSAPVAGIDDVVGTKVHWIDADKKTSWTEIGVPMPDLFLVSSWPHAAYNALSNEARAARDTRVVCMVDNYLRYTPKQFLGAALFRLHYRNIFSAMWVPGNYGRRFMQFLGVESENIYTGLYAADSDLFRPPPENAQRSGLVFVGQLVPRKGLRQLSGAVQALKNRGTLVDLRCIGDGPLREELTAAGLRLLNFQSPQELAETYQKASALILPSELDHWGVVGHEAALSGCLLLVTRQCGCCDALVEHRVNGFVMNDSTEGEIIKAISWLQSLDPLAVDRGREVSLQRARSISPGRWAETLAEIAHRFVPRYDAAGPQFGA